MFLGALAAAAVLWEASPVLGTYWRRVLFVSVLGFFAYFTAGLQGPVWFDNPWGYWLLSALYGILSWFIAGLVLAKFVKASPPPATGTAA
jgi:hypothetical protein